MSRLTVNPTTASVSKNVGSADGSREPTTARTASANAVSVAVGDRPAARVSAVAKVDGEVQPGRYRDAAERRGDRERREPWVAKVAGDELALELEAGDEEEDRQQPVR